MLNDFWKFFAQTAAPQLAHRAVTMRQTFEYLDKCADPLIIVETGSVRTKNNWAGDGQSTVLFDRYAQHREGCVVHTVDIDPKVTHQCLALVSDRVQAHTGNSITFLYQLAKCEVAPSTSWLFYLDSYDVNWSDPYPAAAHHLQELVAISPLIQPDTLIVVDDSPSQPRGKGFLIKDYAKAIGATILFCDYQLGLTGLR